MERELPFRFDINSAAFVVVDMQNDFVRSNAPLGVPDALGTVNPINRVRRYFRSKERPVVFTRFVAGENETLLWTWSPEIREPVNCCKLGHKRFYEDIQKEEEVVAIIDELEKDEKDIQIDKFWYGAFHRTNLEDLLASRAADTVVVAGTVTQICVEETARQAFHHGFKTIILSDCCSSFAPDLHAATLKNLNMKFGAVMTSKEFLELAG